MYNYVTILTRKGQTKMLSVELQNTRMISVFFKERQKKTWVG